MKQIILSAALAILTGPALALSCLPHDVAYVFNQANEANETYIAVRGTLTFDESKLPEVDYNQQENTPPETLIRARLKGKAMSYTGFDRAFDQPITLNAKCFGPWCSGAKSGIEYLAFLERNSKGHTLTLDPCGGFGFPEPTDAMFDKVMQCYKGGPCKPSRF